jgi:hypothetical protein
VSGLPLAVKVGSLIEKETKLLKIPNLKHQITNKSQISIFNDLNRFGILVIGDVFHIRVVAGHEKNNGSCSSVGLMAIIINRYFDSSTAATLKNGQSDRKRNFKSRF